MSGQTMGPAAVAERLGKTEDWVRRAARRGVLPSRKVGRDRRFTEEDVDQYLEQVRVVGSDPWVMSPQSLAALNRGKKKAS